MAERESPFFTTYRVDFGLGLVFAVVVVDLGLGLVLLVAISLDFVVEVFGFGFDDLVVDIRFGFGFGFGGFGRLRLCLGFGRVGHRLVGRARLSIGHVVMLSCLPRGLPAGAAARAPVYRSVRGAVVRRRGVRGRGSPPGPP